MRSVCFIGIVILKRREVILIMDRIKLGVVIELVHNALSYNGFSTLNIQVITLKQLLFPKKQFPLVNRVLGPVVVCYSDLIMNPA